MRKVTVIVVALVAAGCPYRHVGRYGPEHFGALELAPDVRLEGVALVRTTAEEDAQVWSGRPSGKVGSLTEVSLPLGVITREAARIVFGQLFLGGAVTARESPAGGARVIVSPRVSAFEYRYPTSSLFNQGSELWVTLSVKVLDPAGAEVFERRYPSGKVTVRGPSDAQANVNHAAHRVVQALMLRAAGDVREHLTTGAVTPRGDPATP